MSQDAASSPADRVLPRALGVVHMVYALVVGFGMLIFAFYFLLIPGLLEWTQGMAKTRVNATQSRQADQLKDVERMLAEAQDEEKIAQLNEQKVELEVALEFPDTEPKFTTFGMTKPQVMGPLGLQLFSGFFLLFWLFIAGIGLVRLSRWGRVMSLGVAWLMLAQVVLSNATIALVSAPTVSAEVRAKLTELAAARAQTDTAGPNPTTEAPAPAPEPEAAPAKPSYTTDEIAHATGQIIQVHSVGSAVFGSMYPVLTIWLLGRPAVRAAFARRTEEKPTIEDTVS